MLYWKSEETASTHNGKQGDDLRFPFFCVLVKHLAWFIAGWAVVMLLMIILGVAG